MTLYYRDVRVLIDPEQSWPSSCSPWPSTPTA